MNKHARFKDEEAQSKMLCARLPRISEVMGSSDWQRTWLYIKRAIQFKRLVRGWYYQRRKRGWPFTFKNFSCVLLDYWLRWYLLFRAPYFCGCTRTAKISENKVQVEKNMYTACMYIYMYMYIYNYTCICTDINQSSCFVTPAHACICRVNVFAGLTAALSKINTI